MRRRSKREPNNTESTGKIGHELPVNQPRPLVPTYPEDSPTQRSAPLPPPLPVAPKQDVKPDLRQSGGREQRHGSRPQRQAPAAPRYSDEAANSGRLEMETQPDMPSLPPAENEAAGRTVQDPKGFVVLTIGLPGSGKTTWFKRRGVTPLSSDLLRTILFDDITEQRYQGLVFSTLRSLLRARLIARMPWNYVDATNLSPHERRQWIKMAASFGYEVQAVFFDVPLEVCLERNSKRDRPVSDDVMQKMAERLKPPAFDEGFSKITVVRVKSTV
ncbi:ATP-binding protein [Acidicapsa ligni]|uniref:ATP-binding protein n=1 Tax=Acidicapsa ligni TaxID=542300 RepID=UPI0021E0019B|nr:ATP-binding protein [Acidicapsa ligni]